MSKPIIYFLFIALFSVHAFGNDKQFIVLIGPPCSGKTTYAKEFEKQGYVHIYPSGVLRTMLKAGDPLALEYEKQIITCCPGIPSNIIENIVQKILRETLNKNPLQKIVFDGFPRSVKQAEFLSKELRAINPRFDLQAILLKLPKKILIARAMGRLECEECHYVLTAKLKKCPKCSGTIKARAMDKERLFMERLDRFNNWSFPVVEYYQTKNQLKIISKVR